jgi:hypothetical protein
MIVVLVILEVLIDPVASIHREEVQRLIDL